MTKSKHTKRALLASSLSVLLCLAMLVGSTFAWFTDTASTAVNKIQAGTLDVGLEMSNDGGTTWENAEGETLEFIKAPGQENEPVLWEPGCTYNTQQFYIKNNGNLNLKFKFSVSGITGDAKLLEVLDFTAMADASWFKFNTGAISIATSGEFDLLKGYDLDTLFYGTMHFDEYVLEPGKKAGPIMISGHMAESAGNEYQGLSIDGIAITVMATQATGEEDSYNWTYDENAVYPVISVDEFKAALAASDSYISLGSDITVPSTQLGSSGYGKSGLAQTQGGTIDGNGNTISAEGATGTWDATIYTKGGTIKNAEITGGFRGIFIANPTEDIIIDNVIINPIAYPINCDAGSDKNLIVTNSTLNGWTSFAGTLASAEFTNCNFGSNGSYAFLRPYCATTLTNCEFSDGFELDATRTSEITLVNCTYNGTPITAANLISLLGADAAGATVN